MTLSQARYRQRPPLRDGRLYITDGGIETTLIFLEGLELPCFAAFDLLKDEGGRKALAHYYRRYLAIAREHGHGFVLESPTWRANPDWGRKIGYSHEALAMANRDAIALMAALRAEWESPALPIVISGCIGPRGDGYDPGAAMTAAEAKAYHAWQVGVFKDTAADLVTAITMTNSAEAVGVARAARAAQMPVVISFTLETDGRLPTGQALGEAIAEVDAATDRAPLYYMINCAHPTHFDKVLTPGAPWLERLGGLRANASKRSHAELDAATDLDDGDPAEFGAEYVALARRLGRLAVLGGCCGTDHRHVAAISTACAPVS